jgi:hypothetical protein
MGKAEGSETETHDLSNGPEEDRSRATCAVGEAKERCLERGARSNWGGNMENFDWVQERFQCSLSEVFETLKIEVEQDVATRERLRPKNEAHQHYAFKFVSRGQTFSALLEGSRLHKSVMFSLESNHISIRRDGTDSALMATPTLNDEGRCLLKIGNKEYERWQVRKMALEDLFFVA